MGQWTGHNNGVQFCPVLDKTPPGTFVQRFQLKPETADRLVTAFERAAVAVSDQPTAELAVREVNRALVLLLAQFRRARSMERLRAELIGIDEEPSSQTVLLVEAAARFAPKLGIRWIKKAAQQFLRNNRETGRPETIPASKHPEVARMVLESMRRSRTFVQAKHHVANQLGVSDRTIQRIWSTQLDSGQDGTTLEEAELFLARIFHSEPDAHSQESPSGSVSDV